MTRRSEGTPADGRARRGSVTEGIDNKGELINGGKEA